MLRALFQAMLRGARRNRLAAVVLPSRFGTAFESLEAREVPAIVATFTPSAGILTVIGDSLDNNIEISRNAAGIIQVNGGAVVVRGGTATVANTALIQVFGQGGNDTITLN